MTPLRQHSFKKYWFCSLALAVFATFSLAYPQKEKTLTQSPDEALRTKQRSKAFNKDRFAELMSRIDIKVPDTTNLARASAYRQLIIQLSVSDQKIVTNSKEQRQSAQASAVVLTSQVRSGSLPKHRSLELASDQLLMLTVGEGAQLKWWSTMPDPRILRAERTGPDGTLTGEVIFQKSIELTVNIPDDTGAVELRFYHPRWTGQEFVPILIATIPLSH